jgi:hypothetical protein
MSKKTTKETNQETKVEAKKDTKKNLTEEQIANTNKKDDIKTVTKQLLTLTPKALSKMDIKHLHKIEETIKVLLEQKLPKVTIKKLSELLESVNLIEGNKLDTELKSVLEVAGDKKQDIKKDDSKKLEETKVENKKDDKENKQAITQKKSKQDKNGKGKQENKIDYKEFFKSLKLNDSIKCTETAERIKLIAITNKAYIFIDSTEIYTISIIKKYIHQTFICFPKDDTHYNFNIVK